jgi:hypothetical protein
MGDDLEAMADLPDGELSVDVLEGNATHSQAGPVKLEIAKELRAWFLERLKVSSIPSAEIKSATVRAAIKTDRIATNRKKIVSFDFALESTIETNERAYIGQLTKVHRWHQRLPSTNSLKPRPSAAA